MKTKQKPLLSDYKVNLKGKLIYKDYGFILDGVKDHFGDLIFTMPYDQSKK